MFTKKTLEKLKILNKGNQYSKNKHWKLSEETKRKMSLSKRGVIRPPFTNEWREKLRQAKVGSKHPNWKGGITPISLMIRGSREYKLWRKAVYERDNYTCQICTARGVKVHADHIKSFALFPELRFAIDNGRTLCVGCHKKTDTFGARTNKRKPRFL